jgi:tetratricopeptide (TPR) repeat protein
MNKNSSVLDEVRDCVASDPKRALELGNRYIEDNPSDSHGYFSRHLTWAKLGNHKNALADCCTAIGILPKPNRYMARAEIYRALGDHARALADLDHVHNSDHETWLTSFGPHLRADTLARLGRLDEALSDAALIPDNHWMPEHDGLPGGDKQEFITELRRRAAGARSSTR